MGEVKKLIGGPIRHDIGIHIDNLAELGLLPEVDLCEGRMEVWAVHEVEVCRPVIADAADRNHIVIHSLQATVSLLAGG